VADVTVAAAGGDCSESAAAADDGGYDAEVATGLDIVNSPTA
jgi:hypothetical protein